MSKSPRIIGTCLDDFGLHPAVNDAAMDLVERKCLTAVSCLTTAPAWGEGVRQWMRSDTLREGADLGLHFNLTESFPGAKTSRGLGGLIASAYLGQLEKPKIREALRDQLARFEDAAGIAPDYLDGHQHIHQLPVIRDVVVEELRSRYTPHLPWLRRTTPPPGMLTVAALKHRVISALGSRALTRMARKGGFMQNERLLGVYGFSGSSQDYLSRLRTWLTQAREHDLFLCHAATGPIASDTISEARVVELDVIKAQFPALVEEQGIILLRPSRFLAESKDRRVNIAHQGS